MPTSACNSRERILAPCCQAGHFCKIEDILCQLQQCLQQLLAVSCTEVVNWTSCKLHRCGHQHTTALSKTGVGNDDGPCGLSKLLQGHSLWNEQSSHLNMHATRLEYYSFACLLWTAGSCCIYLIVQELPVMLYCSLEATHWSRWFARPDRVSTEPYYELPLAVIPVTKLRPIFHFRVGAHSLPVEQGRIEVPHWQPQVPRHLRGCTFCATNAIGDERHCVFGCPHFRAFGSSMPKFPGYS